MRRSLFEVVSSALQYFRELTHGCYFRFFVVSNLPTTGNLPYKFPIISCDRESAVQNGGERFIVATTTTGESKCVLGEFKLDEGAGTQSISGKVQHYQAFNGKEYAQLLTDLYAVAS